MRMVGCCDGISRRLELKSGYVRAVGILDAFLLLFFPAEVLDEVDETTLSSYAGSR